MHAKWTMWLTMASKLLEKGEDIGGGVGWNRNVRGDVTRGGAGGVYGQLTGGSWVRIKICL